MTQEGIARINFLARKAKAEGLSPEEQEEQARLRREYIDSVKRNLMAQLDHTTVVDENGVKRPLRKQ